MALCHERFVRLLGRSLSEVIHEGFIQLKSLLSDQAAYKKNKGLARIRSLVLVMISIIHTSKSGVAFNVTMRDPQ